MPVSTDRMTQGEPTGDSHVGSLIGPICRVRDAQGLGADSFASPRFSAGNHPQWLQRARAKVFESMQYAPAPCEANATVAESVDCGTHTRERVYFNTTPAFRVPAFVLVPKGLQSKAPAVIALHDHGGFYRWGKEKLVRAAGEHPRLATYRQTGYDGHAIADDLAAQGYVVLVMDAFYWGERRLRLENDPPTGPGESFEDIERFNASRVEMEDLTARTIYSAGATWAGLMLWDDLRALDYLASRPEVDATRLGCVGWSMGGWRAGHLMALDDRIKAGVSVCWLTSYRQVQARHIIWTIGYTTLLPGLYRSLDMPDVISMAAPRPLLCINGDKDGLFPVDTGVRAAYETLGSVYAKLGAADHFRGHLHKAAHAFTEPMQQEAWEWLGRWL